MMRAGHTAFGGYKYGRAYAFSLLSLCFYAKLLQYPEMQRKKHS